ncbi:MAG: D-alanyl-D-alanine carboxypeptidase, partial [Planctomycetota bacterium]
RALHEQETLRTPMVESLPTVGEGTLTRRFRSTPIEHEVRAKSGTIDGVRCFSGYLLDGTGGGIAFSILINDLKRGEQSVNALRLHEAIVAELDTFLSQTRRAREPQVGG